MKYKLLPAATAVLAILASYNATAADTTTNTDAEKPEVKATDVLKDGWEVHGYASMNARMVEGETVDTEYGKPDYKTAGTHGQSTNQVEFTIKKKTEFGNGVKSEFVVRSEYGNGNSFAYSSSGSQKDNTRAQFEIKETYVELSNLPYFDADTSIWAGERFLNRAAGILSGEFWKQSSGVGAGIQSKIAGNTAGMAVVVADTSGDINANKNTDRNTLTSVDFYYYGVKALGGSFDFDAKVMSQANQDSNADSGLGLGITYNRDYYGLDGWTQTALTYGEGVAQNRGINFGQWAGGNDDAQSIFFTSYGVLNITDRLQMGSEITYMGALDELFTAEDLKRYMVAVRPSYKVNDNLRLEMTASYGHEEGKDGYWGRSGDAVESDILNLEIASAFTVNADYFGRPQIKPYVSFIKADDEASAGIIGIKNGDSEVVVGVHTEIWF